MSNEDCYLRSRVVEFAFGERVEFRRLGILVHIVSVRKQHALLHYYWNWDFLKHWNMRIYKTNLYCLTRHVFENANELRVGVHWSEAVQSCEPITVLENADQKISNAVWSAPHSSKSVESHPKIFIGQRASEFFILIRTILPKYRLNSIKSNPNCRCFGRQTWNLRFEMNDWIPTHL